jgi:aquaporin NIP
MLAEAIGTFAIVFFGCGSIILFDRIPGAISVSAIPVIFGLVVAAMIYALGHISGAHFNPVVTLTFAVTRHFHFREVLSYWFGQCGGAVLASVMLWYLFPAGSAQGATLPHVTTVQAFGWEFVMTFFLMVTIMAVATDTRAVGTMAGAAIGAVVMIDAFVGGWATGASMNPARSLAPALLQGALGSLWIYILAPMAGALAGGLLYKVIGKKQIASELMNS